METLTASMLARILRSLAGLLENMDERDFAALLDGPPPKRITGKGKRSSPEAAAFDVEEVLSELMSLGSSELGAQTLSARKLTRAQLVKLAKRLDIHVEKRHGAPEIADKIVDATIGYKTRSAAIRGGPSQD